MGGGEGARWAKRKQAHQDGGISQREASFTFRHNTVLKRLQRGVFFGSFAEVGNGYSRYHADIG